MLDRRLIEEMRNTAGASDLEGAQAAAAVYERMLSMKEGQSMTVQFEPGEDFSIKCVPGGYDIG
ncbi:hypothetical protein L2W58_03285 [Dethiosulfovibrio sp. F2B]|uniref:hypothetical protein n=1 Tax=Dethiosulfovibrio faecalis TaxID=2720018 RepID=UPI001F36F7BD|nr:hypothetical protein [Dethiosulfovibrio faecalis]MCF4150815.1 hypothetical protein [Dethiosulfovibrio faecalis]